MHIKPMTILFLLELKHCVEHVLDASATYTSVNRVAYRHILLVMQNKIRSRGMRQEKLNFTF